MIRRAMLPQVLVVDAARAAAIEQATIARGVPSRALMQRAGAAAAAEIARRFPERMREGVIVHTGPGNNGGDGWVVARSLMQAGVPVRVREASDPRTEDAAFERTLCPETVERGLGSAGIHVDALLGTGSRGAPRGELAAAVELIERARSRGAVVVALDVPSGVDASSGSVSDPAVRADLTLTFGTLKRGLLVAREHAGAIVVLDIGLVPGEAAAGVARLVDSERVREAVPTIPADAHKGSRRRLVVVGGGKGMLGATVLAARAAYRSGIGLVKLCVAKESLPLVQQLAPEAIADVWPEDDEAARELVSWSHGVLIGPGLGRSAKTRALVDRALRARPERVVLDADALNVFEGDVDRLAALLAGRAAVLTPHPVEFARLSGTTPEEVLAERFEVGAALARKVGAVVLLKGVPTVIHSPDAERSSPLVSAAGTPALAVGGSGDLLAGVCATLLAQTGAPFASAACAAWVHGRAGELASAGRSVRGVTLDDVMERLAEAWPTDPSVTPYPVLAELPRVGVPRH